MSNAKLTNCRICQVYKVLSQSQLSVTVNSSAGENDKLCLLVIYTEGHEHVCFYKKNEHVRCPASTRVQSLYIHTSNSDGRQQEAASCFLPSLASVNFEKT